MYSIDIINGSTTTRILGNGQWLGEAVLTESRNAIGALDITMYPDNAGYSLLTPFATLVKVYDGSSVRFEGRVLEISPRMDSDGMPTKQVTCEGLEAYLCDSVQPYMEERLWEDTQSKTGLQLYIEHLLSVHNVRMPESKRIYAGNITLQTYLTTGNVSKGTPRESTWDILRSKLINVFGGEMRVRRNSTDNKLYLDYAQSLGTTRTTSISIGSNMREASREADWGELVTRLYPYGAKLKEEGGTETEERLTIASVNEGVEYLDASTISTYGVIEGVVEFDDVTTASALLSKGQAWLIENAAVPLSTSIKVYDLSLIGLASDRIRLLDKYPCANSLIGMSESLEVVKLKIDLLDPTSTSATFGDSTVLSTANAARSAEDVREIAKELSEKGTTITNLVSHSVTADANLVALQNSIVSQVSEITEDVSTLQSDVDGITSQLTTTNSKVSRVEQTADAWTTTFQSISDIVNSQGETITTNKAYIDSFIQLTMDAVTGKPVIRLGTSASQTELKLENDILGFYQNGVRVAYMSDKKLYIENGQILSDLQLGQYIWRTLDDGSMALKWIGG